MALNYLLKTEQYLMADIWAQNGDPRLTRFSLMSSVRAPTYLMICYLSFVLYFGPKWMAKREPFSLKPVLLVYNLAMSLFNAYVFIVMSLDIGYHAPRMINTVFPPFEDNSPKTQELIDYNYLYLCSKFVDLFDTVFFVLRKKNSQITGLHLWHHFSVAYLGWMGLRMNASCDIGTLFAYINSLIHFIMYLYYFLAALGPSVQPYLWWKRHLTMLQIIQFVFLIIHVVYFNLNQVGYPIFYTYNYFCNVIFYLIFFIKFYMQTYKHKKLD